MIIDPGLACDAAVFSHTSPGRELIYNTWIQWWIFPAALRESGSKKQVLAEVTSSIFIFNRCLIYLPHSRCLSGAYELRSHVYDREEGIHVCFVLFLFLFLFLFVAVMLLRHVH